MHGITLIILIGLVSLAPSLPAANVIFMHIDGAGISHWQAARFYWAGPDADMKWDRIPEIAVYRGHMADALSATSNGAATTHAYGLKAKSKAFGTMGNDAKRPISASGRPGSLMHEAIERGLRTGLINSGSIIEPGTACYVASVNERDDFQEITKQVLESGVDVILSGGEEWFLPEGTKGRHVASGLRKDGLDLVETARKLGYHTVYNREELMAVPEQTKKLLGIFAARNTFNDMPEGKMRESGLPTYDPQAPTLAEMTAAALKILAPGPFFLIVEEEGVDNFGNCNNGLGVLDSLKRADDALAVGIDFLKNNNETLLVTTGDSSAGAMDVLSFLPTPARLLQASKGQDLNGAPYSLAADGSPFLSQPDRSGVRHPFVLTWGSQHDASGGILVRAAGKDASKVRGTFDNTQIYQLMRETLFGDK